MCVWIKSFEEYTFLCRFFIKEIWFPNFPPVYKIISHKTPQKANVYFYNLNSTDGQKLPISMSDRQTVTLNGTLIIDPVERSDAASYTCQAENKQGSTSQRSVNVRVMGESKFG